MDLVPTRRVLGITLIFFTVFVILINLAYYPTIEKAFNSDSNSEGQYTPGFNGGNNQEAEILLDQQGSGYNSLLNYVAFHLLLITTTVIFGVVLSNLYVTRLNRTEVQELVNTCLKLAGFNYKIPYSGRDWEIEDNTTLSFRVDQNLVFEIKYHSDSMIESSDFSPELYGFQRRKHHLYARCEPDQLQLTLQSLRRMINRLHHLMFNIER